MGSLLQTNGTPGNRTRSVIRDNRENAQSDREPTMVIDPKLNACDGTLLACCAPPIKRKRLLSKSKSFGKNRSQTVLNRLNHGNTDLYSDMGGLKGKRLLSTIGDWDFNIFTLNKLTNGRAMFHTTLHLFQEHQLIEIFKLDILKLMRFISLVEDGYHSSNPYHNAVHAADVAQAIHCYLKEPKLAKSLSPLEKLGAIVSAITHDLDHPGVNQAFLIATSNHLASLYNNTSVLENHHWRSAIGLMHESGVFDHFDDSLWKTMEWQLKSLILATDITRQSEFLARFRNHLDQKNLNLEDIEHKNFIMQIALKCADICNPCRPWEVSKRWSELVCDEFFKQGDCERQLNLPVTPLCDRLSTTVPKIQTGFMKFVVTPLFQEWYRFVPSALSEMMLSNISTNHSNWERIAQEAEPPKMQQDQETLLEEEEEDDDVDDDSSSSGNHSNHITQTTVVIIEQEPRPVEEDKENTDPSTDSVPEVSVQLTDDTEEEEEEDLGGEDCLVPLCLYRRHSLPPPLITGRDGLSLPSRRDSFPRSLSRRYSLPVSAMPNSNSFDKLVEKLSSLVECSPTNGTHFDYDQRPKMASGSQNLDAKTLSNATLEASKQTSAHGLDPVPLVPRQYTSEPHIAMLAHQYRLNNRHNNLAHLARNLSVAGLLPRFQQTTGSSQTTSSPQPRSSSSAVSASHPSLPTYSSGSANRLGNNNNNNDITDNVAPVAPHSTQTAPHLDLGSAVRGPRRSLGDTSSLTRCVSGDSQGDRKNSHLVTTHSVDAICLSGVNTADRRSSEPSKHSSMTIATNHTTVTMESLDSNNATSMATSKHQSSLEEETPLLQDLIKFNKDGSTRALDSHNSHANDSFTH